MTFTAIWPTYDGNPDGGERMAVSTPGDVDALVAKLNSTTSGAAMITHDGRQAAPITEASFGPIDAPTPDHLLTAGVSDGYGYLTYVDPAHEMSPPLGSSSSPAYISDYAEYPPGSGVPIEVLAAALKEFLLTAQRPSCVQWQDA